jgi:hypothetical protein
MTHSPTVPNYRYIAFIDEAGDPGTKRVRPIDPVGGTEWMTIGCALFRVEREPSLPGYVGAVLEKLNVRNRPDLHFRYLSPWKQQAACDDLDTGPRYTAPAKALKPKMATEKGAVADFGLTLQPNPYSKQLSTVVQEGTLPIEQREIFEFYGFTF